MEVRIEASGSSWLSPIGQVAAELTDLPWSLAHESKSRTGRIWSMDKSKAKYAVKEGDVISCTPEPEVVGV